MPPELRGRTLGHAFDCVQLGVFFDRRGHESIGRNAHSVARGMDDGQVEIVGYANHPSVRERRVAVALHDPGLRGIHLPGVAVAAESFLRPEYCQLESTTSTSVTASTW